MKPFEQRYEVNIGEDTSFVFQHSASHAYSEEIETLLDRDQPFKRDEHKEDIAFERSLAFSLLRKFKPRQKCIPYVNFAEDGLNGVEFYDYSVGDDHQGRLSVRSV